MMETIVITSAINIIPNQNYSHEFHSEIREKTYLSNLLFYITNTKNIQNIVFCDGTGFDFMQWNYIYKIAEKFNKKLEFLSFTQNASMIKKFGYGYGEAEILDYIYDNSLFIDKKNARYKITGRYLIPNIDDIISKTTSYDSFFLKTLGTPTLFTVSTFFFKVSNDVRLDYLYQKVCNTYRSLDNNIKAMEMIYYSLLKQYLFTTYKTFYSNDINIRILVINPQSGFKYLKIQNILFEKLIMLVGLNRFGTVSKIIDKCFYNLYHNKRRNNFFLSLYSS